MRLERDSRILVAGARGMVGSAIVRLLRARGYECLLTPARYELDLTRQEAVERWLSLNRPDYVFLAAAKVGGIYANDTYPGQFIYSNLMVEANVIHAAWKAGVRKLLFLGSSCIYPKDAPQPMREEALLTGALEPTNEWYAVAKIAGIKLCQAYRKEYGFHAISLMPTNLYGPGDNFELKTSHVLPALIRKFHEAKQSGASAVSVWGSGRPRREFLHVDDLADACLYLMENYDSPEVVNVGVGQDITIAELTGIVKAVAGYTGQVEYDPSKPDGTPRKLLDVSKLTALGWQARIPLSQGIAATYRWYLDNLEQARR